MKYPLILLSMATAIGAFTSCQECAESVNIDLSAQEEKWIETHQIGDSIRFISDADDTITIVVSDIQRFFEQLDQPDDNCATASKNQEKGKLSLSGSPILSIQVPDEELTLLNDTTTLSLSEFVGSVNVNGTLYESTFRATRDTAQGTLTTSSIVSVLANQGVGIFFYEEHGGTQWHLLP